MSTVPGTDQDLVGQAVAELYAAEPDQFVDRRRVLVAAARAGGDGDAATQIAALRKPTRSAWTVNVLARDDPAAVRQLLDLGDELRQAEQQLDGTRLRELSTVRRQLVDGLARKAFTMTKQPAPAAAVREDVLSTLSAAVADPQVAERVGAGTVLRAAHWDGFGSATRPDLVLVTTPTFTAVTPIRRAGAPKPASGVPRPGRQARPRPDRTADEAPSKVSAAIVEAEAALTEARNRLAAAEADERRHAEQLRQAEVRAAELRAELSELRRDVQSARSAVRDARTQVHRVRRR